MLEFPSHIDHVARLAQVSELRQRVISHNLANANTPNYQRQDITFEQDFIKAIQRGEDSTRVRPEVVQEQGLVSGLDGNNVDMDREIGALNKNSLLFQTYSQIMSTYLDSMRRAMRS